MKNYTKKGGKGLKNASFWAITSKKFRFCLDYSSAEGQGFRPQCGGEDG